MGMYESHARGYGDRCTSSGGHEVVWGGLERGLMAMDVRKLVNGH